MTPPPPSANGAASGDARPRRAMVLAAGHGTRLRPLTEHRPKPAVPLCGVPAIRYNLARLAAAGVREVVVNTHALPDAIRAAAGDGLDLGLSVSFSHEPEILGTGGGLAKVADRFADGAFYLVNGKILYDADLEGALELHGRLGATATMLLRPYPEGGRYGVIEIDAGARVRRFVGRFSHPGPLTPCMFTGVHVLTPRVLAYLPEQGASCINADGYVAMLEAGEPVAGHLDTRGYFADPSTPERYLDAVCDLLGGRVDLARFREGGVDPFADAPDRGGGVRVHAAASIAPGARLVGPCWIGPGARVEAGAEVGPFVAVEAGARVGSGARVRRSAVWPEARVAGSERLDRVIAVNGERTHAPPAAAA